MCGIVGAVAQRNVVPILLEGLRRLEYRGYDSAGLVIVNNGLQRVRSVGRVASLTADCAAQQVHGHLGIAHTRWATHGAPSEANAHPHVSGKLAVVHNGIIENHEALRSRLKAAGFTFTSETDTEVIVHLIELHYRQSKNLLAATRAAVAELEGAYAIGVVSEDAPNRLICARRGSPLLIGLGIEENFIASDVSALLPVTQRVMYLEEGDVADIGLLSVDVYDAAGKPADRSVHVSELSADMAELGTYRHFMQKEIHEQPRALTDTLLVAVAQDHIQPEWFGFDAAEVLGKVNAVTFLACGTSYHAAKVATYWLEEIAGIPATAEIASEYRYRTSVPNPDALIVTISHKTLTICNVPESALTRASRLKFLTRAGPEIGVASTKAFTTQLAGLFLLTLVLAKLRGKLTPLQETAHLTALRGLPNKVQQALALEPQVEAWSHRFANKHHALFLGRGVHYPIALEGALKLKEISYIHAEAYPAGELKHGPLALVDEDMPVITIAPNDQLIEKLKSNLQEVRARGGELYVFADGDVHLEESPFVHVIKLPGGHNGALSPILHTIPLQLLSYHAALQKGTDVDKPRNLAKSVTVE
ncbi:MAG: glutamine--fructose-6-phosphate transaminase (isomerizing) [Hydrogenophilales bacterium 12-61-10]|nr:MAG: glutamine--fructose-6-phosphate transaminase (isomerizing) [Hydrogenophilales bacterium 12-61-10]